MSAVKNDNYFQVQGWMVNELGLKGNDLLVYAIIYGFSQTDDQYFTGSQQYLADWTNSTKKGIRKNLQSLVEKGLLIKIDKTINNVKYCEYKALRKPITSEQKPLEDGEQSSPGGEQSSPGWGTEFPGGREQSSPNNIDNNKENNIKDNIGDKVKELYNDTCVSFPRLMILSDARRKTINTRLKNYSLDDMKRLFEKAEASSFLKGKNNRNWSANFDWLMKDSNIVKVLEGNYDDKPGSSFAGNTNKVAESLDNSYSMIEEWAKNE